MALKLLGLGIQDYLRDKMNIFDGSIVIISIVELSVGDGDSLKGV